ncbi:MAG: hypothetical protein M0R03_18660 [Novosphingobium sp.]|jgi:hypothetical protein|nr:hypothetical protein [Novosphingobium sp.]
MVNFFRNTDPVVPVLFYFDKAEVLRGYEAFTVEPMFQARPHQTPAEVTIWTVCAKVRFVDRREQIAEFPNQLYAEIFRDMAEVVAARI